MELQLKLVYVNITVSLDCVKIKKILITKINCSVALRKIISVCPDDKRKLLAQCG